MATTMRTRFKFLLPGVKAPVGQVHGFAASKWVIYKIFINIACCVIKVTHFLRLHVWKTCFGAVGTATEPASQDCLDLGRRPTDSVNWKASALKLLPMILTGFCIFLRIHQCYNSPLIDPLWPSIFLLALALLPLAQTQVMALLKKRARFNFQEDLPPNICLPREPDMLLRVIQAFKATTLAA